MERERWGERDGERVRVRLPDRQTDIQKKIND